MGDREPNTNCPDHTVSDCLEWSNSDFKQHRLRVYFDNQGISDEIIGIRAANLRIVAKLCRQCRIPFWLFGKTLLGLHRDQQFIIDDHDDDIGVPAEQRTKVCVELYPLLQGQGFQAIRNNESMLSVLRNDRYIDICFFKRNGAKVGYGEKWYSHEFFDHFATYTFNDDSYPIPRRTNELLQLMYPDSGCRQEGKPPSFLRDFHKDIKKTLRKSRKKLKNTVLNRTLKRFLTIEEFVELEIEPVTSINWHIRAPHLNIITDNGRVRRIKEIIDYLRDRGNFEDITAKIKETDTSQSFVEPINLNYRFWRSGNNYFLYCILYGFRKGVISYSQTNNYIENGHSPTLYSAAYFESLAPMTDDEIRRSLETDPIVIDGGSVVHGKHRVCAMIGRLINEKAYLPFHVEETETRFS